MKVKGWVIASILGLAIILRFINLNSLPIFADESIYIRWAQVMRAESSLRFLPLSDGKQPLYMWAVIPVLKLVSDPLLAGRLLSALAGVVTVVGVGVLGYLLFKKERLGLMAAAIYAVIPYAVFFDRMALVDSMLAMWLVWTAIFFLAAVQKRRLDMAMAAGFTLGFAWLTKSPAIFALILLPSLLLLANRKDSWKSAWLLVPTYVIAWGMYNVLRLGPEFHMIALRNKDYVYSVWEIAKHPLDPLKPHLRDALAFYLYLTTPLGLVLTIWGIVAGKWAHWRTRAVLALWWAGPLVIQAAIAKGFTARYLLFTLPFAVLLMAHAVEHIGEKTKRHRLAWGLLLLLVVVGGGESLALIYSPQLVPLPRVERAGYLEEWTAGFGIRDVAQQLRQVAKAGPVVVGSEGYFGTPFNALQLYLNDVPNVRVIGIGVWVDKVSPDLTNALAANQVYLVVNSSRFHVTDPASIGLKLLASYPKATPPSGETEYLLFFKVQ